MSSDSSARHSGATFGTVGEVVEQRNDAATEIRDFGEGVSFPAFVGGDKRLPDRHIRSGRGKVPRPDETESRQIGDEWVELDTASAHTGFGVCNASLNV
jgi:hypothetical protein